MPRVTCAVRVLESLQPLLDDDAPFASRRCEGGVVALVLVCVRDCELGERTVERVATPEVGGDRDPVAGARVGAGEEEAADLPIERQSLGQNRVEVDRGLPVPELTDEEVALGTVEGVLRVQPAK